MVERQQKFEAVFRVAKAQGEDEALRLHKELVRVDDKTASVLVSDEAVKLMEVNPRLLTLRRRGIGTTQGVVNMFAQDPKMIDIVEQLHFIEYHGEKKFELSDDTNRDVFQSGLMEKGTVLQDGFQVSRQGSDRWVVNSGEDQYTLVRRENEVLVYKGDEKPGNITSRYEAREEEGIVHAIADGTCANRLVQQLESDEKRQFFTERKLGEKFMEWAGTRNQPLIAITLKRLERFDKEDQQAIDEAIDQETNSEIVQRDLACHAVEQLWTGNPLSRFRRVPIQSFNINNWPVYSTFSTKFGKMEDFQQGRRENGFSGWYDVIMEKTSVPEGFGDYMKDQTEACYRGTVCTRLLLKRDTTRVRNDMRELAILLDPERINEPDKMKQVHEKLEQIADRPYTNGVKLHLAYAAHSTLKYLSDGGYVDFNDPQTSEAVSLAGRMVIVEAIDRHIQSSDSKYPGYITAIRMRLNDKVNGMPVDEISKLVSQMEAEHVMCIKPDTDAKGLLTGCAKLGVGFEGKPTGEVKLVQTQQGPSWNLTSDEGEVISITHHKEQEEARITYVGRRDPIHVTMKAYPSESGEGHLDTYHEHLGPTDIDNTFGARTIKQLCDITVRHSFPPAPFTLPSTCATLDELIEEVRAGKLSKAQLEAKLKTLENSDNDDFKRSGHHLNADGIIDIAKIPGGKLTYFKVKDMDKFESRTNQITRAMKTGDSSSLSSLTKILDSEYRSSKLEFLGEYDNLFGQIRWACSQIVENGDITEKVLHAGMKSTALLEDVRLRKHARSQKAATINDFYVDGMLGNNPLIDARGSRLIVDTINACAEQEDPILIIDNITTGNELVRAVDHAGHGNLVRDVGLNPELIRDREGEWHMACGEEDLRLRIVEGKKPGSKRLELTKGNRIETLKVTEEDGSYSVFGGEKLTAGYKRGMIYTTLALGSQTLNRELSERLIRLDDVDATVPQRISALEEVVDKARNYSLGQASEGLNFPYTSAWFALPAVLLRHPELVKPLYNQTNNMTPEEVLDYLKCLCVVRDRSYYTDIATHLANPEKDGDGYTHTPGEVLEAYTDAKTMSDGIRLIDTCDSRGKDGLEVRVRDLSDEGQVRIFKATDELDARTEIPPIASLLILDDMIELEETNPDLAERAHGFLIPCLRLSVHYGRLTTGFKTLDPDGEGDFILTAKRNRDIGRKIHGAAKDERTEEFTNARKSLESIDLGERTDPEAQLIRRLKQHAERYDAVLENIGVVVAAPDDKEFTDRYGPSFLDTMLDLGKTSDEGIAERPDAAVAYYRTYTGERKMLTMNLNGENA